MNYFFNFFLIVCSSYNIAAFAQSLLRVDELAKVYSVEGRQYLFSKNFYHLKTLYRDMLTEEKKLQFDALNFNGFNYKNHEQDSYFSVELPISAGNLIFLNFDRNNTLKVDFDLANKVIIKDKTCSSLYKISNNFKKINSIIAKSPICSCISNKCQLDITPVLGTFFLDNLGSFHNGANCFNTSLILCGIQNERKIVDGKEINAIFESDKCKKKKGEPGPGDIGAIKILNTEGLEEEIETLHVFFFITKDFIFEKPNFSEYDPYRFADLKSVLQQYEGWYKRKLKDKFAFSRQFIKKNQTDIEKEFFLEIYSCKP